MVAKNAGRSTRRQKTIAKNLRAQRQPCWLCGQAIDYELQWPDPNSFSSDHVYVRSKHLDKAEDPANQRAAHLICNQKRGDRNPEPALGRTSRQW